MPASSPARAGWPRSLRSSRCRSPKRCSRAVGAERARLLALTGGDDYELLFRGAGVQRLRAWRAELPPERWGYARIGELRAGAGRAKSCATVL